MNYRIKGIFLLLCATGICMLCVFFLSPSDAIEVEMPLVTSQMIDEYVEQTHQAAQKRHNAEAARKRAELEASLYQCQSDDQCIIVDKDPCGCLIGPEGVTAINSELSLEFSRLVEKQFAQATACPSVGTAERECSASAAPACVEGRCTILY